MKNCPFCAEPIQDAAVVCKHCGRDLVARPSVFKTLSKITLAIIGVVVGGLFVLGVIGAVTRPSTAIERDSQGKCVLHARAAVITGDTPLGQAMHWDTDVLAIRSLDVADWRDVEVTIFGFVTTGTRGKEQTGAYRTKKGSVSAGELTAFNLKDFEKANGERWVPLTMSVDAVDVKASLLGVACAVEVSPHASAPDLTNR